MSSLIAAVEGLTADLDKLELESVAMETVVINRLGPTARKPLDLAMTHMGLESASSLCVAISKEGVFSWVKTKLSVLGRKINLLVNKVYARLTKADAKTKELLARATKDPNVTLPLSGKQASAILSAMAVTVAGISYATVALFTEPDKEKLKKKLEGYRTHNKEIIAWGKEVSFRRKNQKVKDYRNIWAAVARRNRKRIEKIENKLSGAETKGFLNKLIKGFASIREAVTKFTTKFKSSESAVGSAAKSSGNDAAKKKSLWKRIALGTRAVKYVFIYLKEYITFLWQNLTGKYN